MHNHPGELFIPGGFLFAFIHPGRLYFICILSVVCPFLPNIHPFTCCKTRIFPNIPSHFRLNYGSFGHFLSISYIYSCFPNKIQLF